MRRPVIRGGWLRQQANPVHTLSDFSGGALPSGWVAAFAGPGLIWRKTGTSTIEAIATGGYLSERLEDIAGVGDFAADVFDAFENRLGTNPDGAGPDPTFVTLVNRWARLGGFPDNVPHFGDGPSPYGIGLAEAALVGDNSALLVLGRQESCTLLAGSGVASTQLWAKKINTGPNGAPTKLGFTQGIASPDDRTMFPDTLNTWFEVLSPGTNVQPYIVAVPSGGPDDSVLGVGDRLFWGGATNIRSGARNVYARLPLCDTSLAMTQPPMANAAISAEYLNSATGEVGFECTYRLPYKRGAGGTGVFDAALIKYVITILFTSGKTIKTYFQYQAGGVGYTVNLNVNGVDIIQKTSLINGGLNSTDGVAGGAYNTEAYLRCRHDAANNRSLIEVAYQGCYLSAAVGGATVNFVGDTIANMWFGTDQGATGTSMLDSGITRMQSCVGNSWVETPKQIVFLTDSVQAQAVGGVPLLLKSPSPTMIMNTNECRLLKAGGTIGYLMIGKSGASNASQMADFALIPWKASSSLEAIFYCTGVNDVFGAATSAQIILDDIANVATLKATNPGAFVVVCLMTPCAGYITATFGGGAAAIQAKFDAVNLARRLGVAGADLTVTEMYDHFDDGTGNIWSTAAKPWNNGDNLHLSFAGKQESGTVVLRNAVVALGLL